MLHASQEHTKGANTLQMSNYFASFVKVGRSILLLAKVYHRPLRNKLFRHFWSTWGDPRCFTSPECELYGCDGLINVLSFS